MSQRRAPAKRLLDLAVAVPAALFTAPLVGALAVAVRATSPGPAFFRQQRIGRGGKPFSLIKLRSMTAAADKHGPGITAAGDARITPLGRLLRASKLDELPQLWNVVLGDMSLVGPRPEAPRYVERYRPEWRRLFDVRPGITDEASIVFRDEEALLALAADRERAYVEAVLPAKLGVALDAVEQASLAADLRTICRTAAVVLRLRDESRHPALAAARRDILALNAELAPSNGARPRSRA